MRALSILSILLALGIAVGLLAHHLKSAPEPTPAEMTITVVESAEEKAERLDIQKILDESFAGSEVKSWWRHPNGTTTVRGSNKTNGMFDAIYDQKTKVLTVEYDRDRKPLP